MRHTVRLHGVVIGYSELEDVEPSWDARAAAFARAPDTSSCSPSSGCSSRRFPLPARTASDAAKLERYHRSRDALGLALEDDTGRAIRTSAIHISDYSEQRGGSIDLEVLISDPAYWSRRTGSA